MGTKKSGRNFNQNEVQRLVSKGTIVPEGDPEEATNARPGSAEKLAVLAERSARGEPLFGSDDKDVFRVGTELIGNRGDEHLARRGEIRSNSGRKKKNG